MAVFRIEKTGDYTVMSNHHLKNKKLSLKAKGLLSMILSLPEDWDYTLKGLSYICPEGVDAIRAAVNELEKAGYIIRSRKRNEKGQLTDAEYVIYEQPVSVKPVLPKPILTPPTLENPIQVTPILEKTTQLNTKVLNKQELNTDKINPSINQADYEPKEENIELSDGLSDEELEIKVLEELEQEQAIPYCYSVNERKMAAAIHLLTGFEERLLWFERTPRIERNDFAQSTFLLFNEALIEMLTSRQPMNLKGANVTYAKVYDKLSRYVCFDGGTPHIYELLETATSDFESACKETTIKNHLQYMKSCIWTAMQVGDIGVQALIKRDFG